MLRSAVCVVWCQNKNGKFKTKNLCLFQQVEYLCWFGYLNRLRKYHSVHSIAFQTHWKDFSICTLSPSEIYLFQTPPSVILNGGYGCFSGTTHLVILAICMHDLASITGMWQLRQVPTTVKKYELIRIIITYSKYFPLSAWLKPHAKFTITSCC